MIPVKITLTKADADGYPLDKEVMITGDAYTFITEQGLAEDFIDSLDIPSQLIKMGLMGDGVEITSMELHYNVGVLIRDLVSKRKEALRPERIQDWCKCGNEIFESYPMDGECDCGMYLHHVHCRCGGVSQVG